MGKYGADRLFQFHKEGEKISVLTHCNTGSLATAGESFPFSPPLFSSPFSSLRDSLLFYYYYYYYYDYYYYYYYDYYYLFLLLF